MKKVILIVIMIGFLLNLTACHECPEYTDTDNEKTALSTADFEPAIVDLIASLDNLNHQYNIYSRSGNKDDTQQPEQDPNDTLHVIPAWVDDLGMTVGGTIGGAAGGVIGTIIGGPYAGYAISGLLGTASGMVIGAATSAVAQYYADCNGLAYVSNPGYIDPVDINFISLGLSDSISSQLNSTFVDSIGYYHNYILSNVRNKVELKSNPNEEDYKKVLKACLAEYNKICPDSLRLNFNDSIETKVIVCAKELTLATVPAINREISYSEFVDKTCEILDKHIDISQKKIKVLKEFSAKVHVQYGLLPDNELRITYANNVSNIIRESEVSEELKTELLLESSFGMSSINYWDSMAQ